MRALTYLLVWTAANRLRAQAKRLRQPKYLAAAVAGAAYFWFFLIRPHTTGRPPPDAAAALAWWNGPDAPLLLESAGALMLLAAVIANWLLPGRRAALEFTEAEVAFLFPAPISRLTLINFRLLRSQPALIFTALLLTLFGSGLFRQCAWWALAFGWWALFSALEFHRLGAAFVRTRWLDRGITNTCRRLTVLAVIAALVGGAGAWGWVVYPPLTPEITAEAERMTEWLRGVVASGPVFWILLPFRVLFRPMMVTDPAGFLWTALPAGALLALLYLWVIRSRVAFEEASLVLSQRRAQALRAARGGNWHLSPVQAKPRRDPFALGAQGPRWIAYLWKNLIAGRVLSSRPAWLVMGLAIGLPVVIVSLTNSRAAGLWIIGPIVVGVLPMTFLIGPQLLVFDLRQDLRLADVLKAHPIPAWQMVLGQVAAPALVLWIVQAVLLLVAAIVLGNAPGRVAHDLPWSLRLAAAVTGILLAPGINLLSLSMLNAAAVTFPSWVRFDPERARSFEAMGQYMLLMLAQVLILGIALLPAAMVFFGGFVLGRIWLPIPLALPICGGAAAGVLIAEAAAAIRIVGRLFERLDLSEELLQSSSG